MNTSLCESLRQTVDFHAAIASHRERPDQQLLNLIAEIREKLDAEEGDRG